MALPGDSWYSQGSCSSGRWPALLVYPLVCVGPELRRRACRWTRFGRWSAGALSSWFSRISPNNQEVCQFMWQNLGQCEMLLDIASCARLW